MLKLKMFPALFLLSCFGYAQDNAYFDLSLDELLQLEVASGTLTETDRRHMPAAVTTILKTEVTGKGVKPRYTPNTEARSLDELLEINVPGFIWMLKSEAPQGLRGIISDRNNKLLMVVNGRVMNDYTQRGAISERFLSMLGDIRDLEVVRGPGAVVYGPGALAGVINIRTFNCLNFNGLDVNVRGGAVADFTSAEVRYGKQWDQDTGMFFYYGVDRYQGADSDDAEFRASSTFTTGQNTNFQTPALTKPAYELNPLHGSYEDAPRHKLHLHFNHGRLESWVRYTEGGTLLSPERNRQQAADPERLLGAQMGYVQLTGWLGYNRALSKHWNLRSALSYDIYENQQNFSNDAAFTANGGTNGLQRYGEHETYGKLLLAWDPNNRHQLAFGVEYSAFQFGEEAHMLSGRPEPFPGARPVRTGLGQSHWSTHIGSVLGEYNFKANKAWTFWLGGRVDKHQYSETMFSPRASVIWTPDDVNGYKLIYNRSVRRGDDIDLRRSYNNGNLGETETIDVLEVRYERQHSANLWFDLGAYYDDYAILAWDGAAGAIRPFGNLELWGAEAEARWSGDDTRWFVSHSYTTQIDFDLREGIRRNNVSAAPYGYGNDLAVWPGHVTKLTFAHDFSKAWSVKASLRGHWGLPGARDMADFNGDHPTTNAPSRAYPLTDGSNRAFKGTQFFNLGLEFQPTEHLVFRLDGYNLVGLASGDANKRSYFLRVDQYRQEAAALAFSGRYKF